MQWRNPNAWRWELDPRDPDYDDPPSDEDLADDQTQEIDDVYDDQDGPRNYWPMKGDV